GSQPASLGQLLSRPTAPRPGTPRWPPPGRRSRFPRGHGVVLLTVGSQSCWRRLCRPTFQRPPDANRRMASDAEAADLDRPSNGVILHAVAPVQRLGRLVEYADKPLGRPAHFDPVVECPPDVQQLSLHGQYDRLTVDLGCPRLHECAAIV